MNPSAELLWRLNREYVNRLGRARSFFDLLEQLVLERGAVDQTPVKSALQASREVFARIAEDHRAWCYNFFYESPETKRMVQSQAAIDRALSHFSDMNHWHQRDFNELAALFRDQSRPDPDVTRVPQGDLWEMMQHAFKDLLDFSNMLLEI